MDRTELVITLLGLVATFCMPWPGAEGLNEGAAAMRMQAEHNCRSVQAATSGALAVVQPER